MREKSKKRFFNFGRIKGYNKNSAFVRLTVGLIAICVAVSGYTMLINTLVEGTLAAPLGYPVIFNHPYTPPSPPPPIFCAEQTAWSRYVDHPGFDYAYTRERATLYTGDTSPDHIYVNSTSMVFLGYETDANMDYIFADEYSAFKSISFAIRPLELGLHALDQSGFLFNGYIDPGGKYYGYAITLEARDKEYPEEGRCADLKLYAVNGAPMDTPANFNDPSKRTLISTYAVGFDETYDWPEYVRVESDPVTHRFQIYVDGMLRTNNLNPLSGDSGFGFFSNYIAHDCTELTVMSYSVMQVEADWVSKSALAEVRFIDNATGLPLADPQFLAGQTGQSYYIKPPTFPGYALVSANQKLLNPIRYYANNDYNVTTLVYVDKSAGEKTASYHNVPDNGTLEFPVPVDVNEYIDYNIHVGGDGTRYEGQWVQSTVQGTGLLTMKNFVETYTPTNMLLPNSLAGLPTTSIDGKMTVESNYPIEIGDIQSSANGFGANDGTVIGFTPNNRQPGVPSNLQINGNPGLPALDYTVPFPPAPAPPAPFTLCACTGATHTLHSNAEERYIKITYNELRNDAGYKLNYLLGAWTNGVPEDYFITIHGLNYLGTEVNVVVNRNSIFSPNNGWTSGTRPVLALLPLDGTDSSQNGTTPVGKEYLPDGYVYPINGKIDVTFTRAHNSHHDHNILIGAGEMNMRARTIIVTVRDYLPPGVSYVKGSSGQYEGNLRFETAIVDGVQVQVLVWEFGVLPPNGYEIPFRVHIDRGGFFENFASIDYEDPPVKLPDIDRTNSTFHATDIAAVVEHYVDYNDHFTALKPNRSIIVPRHGNYTTSTISMTDIFSDGGTYRYMGYTLGDAPDSGNMIPGPPPSPTISDVTGEEHIYLYFAKNPTITVEFRYIGDDSELKPSVSFPITSGDPFFLPDSVRAAIPDGSGGFYNYVAYVKNAEESPMPPIVYGLPDRPVYTEVTDDHTVIIYFDNSQNAVTVHYVEYQNEANVLHNNDYYLVDIGDTFVTEDHTPPVLNVTDKRYVYEGYSLPGGSFIPGPPPSLYIDGDKEITLHYSTTYMVTVKWHENLPYDAGLYYADLLPPATFTVRAGDPFSITAQQYIVYNGLTYETIDMHKWTDDSRPAYPGSYTAPVAIPSVNGDYTIILLYEETATTKVDEVSVTVMYTEFGNTGNELHPRVEIINIPVGSDFYLTPYFLGTIPAPPGWTYYASQIDRNPVDVGPPPSDPVFTNLWSNHVIMLQYIPQGGPNEAVVVERFLEFEDPSNILLPERTSSFDPAIGHYPASWIPPGEIEVSARYRYEYIGYKVNGGPTVFDPDPGNIPRPMPGVVNGTTIIYYYTRSGLVELTEEFRLWDDWNEKLDDDIINYVFEGDPFVRDPGRPPDEIRFHSGEIFRYVGYSLNYDKPAILGRPPRVPFPEVKTDGYVITYLYMPWSPFEKNAYINDSKTAENGEEGSPVRVHGNDKITYTVDIFNPGPTKDKKYDVLFAIDWSGSLGADMTSGGEKALDYEKGLIKDMAEFVFDNYPDSRVAFMGMNTPDAAKCANNPGTVYIPYQSDFLPRGAYMAALNSAFDENDALNADDNAAFLRAAVDKFTDSTAHYGSSLPTTMGGNPVDIDPRGDGSRIPVIILVSDFQMTDLMKYQVKAGGGAGANLTGGLDSLANQTTPNRAYWSTVMYDESLRFENLFPEGILITVRLDTDSQLSEYLNFSGYAQITGTSPLTFNAPHPMGYADPFFDGLMKDCVIRNKVEWDTMKVPYDTPYGDAFDALKEIFGQKAQSPLIITDTVPSGLAIDTNSISHGGVYNPVTRTITWDMTEETTLGMIKLTFDVTVDHAGHYDNTAYLNDGEWGTNTTYHMWYLPYKDAYINLHEIFGPARPQNGRECNPVRVEYEDIITYKIGLDNKKTPPPNVNGSVITDVVPDGLEVILSSISHGGSYDAGTRTITWDLTGENEGEMSVTFDAVVKQPGLYSNVAHIVYGDGIEEEDTDTTCHLWYPVEKNAYINDAAEAENGEENDPVQLRKNDKVTYTIDLFNAKTEVAYDVLFAIDWSGSMENFMDSGKAGSSNTSALEYGSDLISDIAQDILNSCPDSRISIMGSNAKDLHGTAYGYNGNCCDDPDFTFLQFDSPFVYEDLYNYVADHIFDYSPAFDGKDPSQLLAAAVDKMTGIDDAPYGSLLSPSAVTPSDPARRPESGPYYVNARSGDDMERVPIIILISDFRMTEEAGAENTTDPYGNYWKECMKAQGDRYFNAFPDGILLTIRMDHQAQTFDTSGYTDLMEKYVSPAGHDKWGFMPVPYDKLYANALSDIGDMVFDRMPLFIPTVVTDTVPEGLEIDEPSISHGGVYDPVTRTITWDLSEEEIGLLTLSFDVAAQVPGLYENTARIDSGGGFAEDTNTTWHYMDKFRIHVRQIVIDPITGVPLPFTGYFTLTSGSDVTGVTGRSGLLGEGVEFTDYYVFVDIDGLMHIYDIIPQNYEFIGSYANGGSAADPDHESDASIVPGSVTANGSIVANYNDEGEWWVTVYISPKESGGDNYTSEAINEVGELGDVKEPSLKSIQTVTFSPRTQHANIVICMDMSSSMNNYDILEGSIKAGKEFVNELYLIRPVDVSVNLITYNYRPYDVITVDDDTYADLITELDSLNPSMALNGTNLAVTLDWANANLTALAAAHPNRENFVFLISDGRPSNNNLATSPIDEFGKRPVDWHDWRNDREDPAAIQAIQDAGDLIKEYANFYSVYYGGDLSRAAPIDQPKITQGLWVMQNLASSGAHYFEAYEDDPGTLLAEIANIVNSMIMPHESTVPADGKNAVIQLLHPLEVSVSKPLTLRVNGVSTDYADMAGFPDNLTYDGSSMQLILDVSSYAETDEVKVEYWIDPQP
ncbi:MAG: VWA domain-containing protein [Oscillospiraceae bacterium]|nr:VWA domain-containing protein [Oscillospiraceae bacterium]